MTETPEQTYDTGRLTAQWLLHHAPGSTPTAPRRLPLPPPMPFTGDTETFFTITTVDNRGRLAGRSPVRQMDWPPGQRLDLTARQGIVAAVARPSGRWTVTSQGHLRLPQGLRHHLRLRPGGRVLVAAHRTDGILLVHPLDLLDALLTAHVGKLGGAP
ncbi:hypothetical protein ACN28G_14670 [Micromonospora sp. WMMA1923]|uniref:hypothetical protein n=1 Tax=Micromonospora sp. WMMA1923 TaxID=3404125 RepID=UPI003B95DE8B